MATEEQESLDDSFGHLQKKQNSQRNAWQGRATLAMKKASNDTENMFNATLQRLKSIKKV